MIKPRQSKTLDSVKLNHKINAIKKRQENENKNVMKYSARKCTSKILWHDLRLARILNLLKIGTAEKLLNVTFFRFPGKQMKHITKDFVLNQQWFGIWVLEKSLRISYFFPISKGLSLRKENRSKNEIARAALSAGFLNFRLFLRCQI